MLLHYFVEHGCKIGYLSIIFEDEHVLLLFLTFYDTDTLVLSATIVTGT
jgi:hypothetical protein